MNSQTDHITSVSSILTAIVGFIIAVSIPAAYFIITYHYMMGAINTETAFSARTIEELVVKNPKSWQFEEIRLQEILERRLDNTYDNRTIRDLKGHVVAKIREPLAGPVVTISQYIYDSGTATARIEIERSVAPLIARTVFVGACSTLLGIIIFLVFRSFPLSTVRKAYERLEENERRLSLALKSGRFGVLDWNIGKNVMIWDDRMYEIYGFPKEAAGISVEAWQSSVHPEDHERFMEGIRPEVIAERGFGIGFRIVRPDGAVRNIETDGILLRDEDGNPSRLIGLNHDITERKQAEEALKESEENYRQIFHRSPAAIYRMDFRKVRISHANDIFCEYYGCSQEEVTSLNPFDMLSEESKKRFLERVEKVAQGLEVPDTVEYEIISRTGKTWHVQLHNKYVFDEEGRTIAADVVATDIPERILMEDALLASEERFRSFVTTSQEWIWAIDAGGILTFTNPAVENILGYHPDEITGTLLPEHFIYEEDIRKIGEGLGRSIKQKTGWLNYVSRWRHRDGTYRYLESSAVPILDKEGVLKGFQGTNRDITDRKRAEEALRESQELYTRLVDALPDIVIRTDLDRNILFVNDYTLQISGYARKEIEGSNVMKFVPHEEWERMIQNSLLRMHRRLETQEYHLIMKDGRHVPFEVNGAVLQSGDGTPIGCVYICRDVSERKLAEEKSCQSEERFHKVFMTSPECIAITSLKEGLIIDVNPGFEEITGWKRDEAIGRTSSDINFWADLSMRDLMVHDLKNGIEINHREFQFCRCDGSVRTGIYSARIMDVTGEPCLIFFLQDITEQRRMEEERRKLEHQLVQSQKMDAIGQLAGGVAHDFNNMLNVILGNTELAMDRVEPSDPLHNTLQEVLNAADRSADLTRQLLAFARKQTVNPRELALNDAVKGILKMLKRLIGEHITLSWTPAEELWSIRIDPSQVDQILANLVVNARDAMNRTGEIGIETFNTVLDKDYCSGHPEFDPGEYVVLVVRDNACGMKKEILANIFEPFFTTKKEGQGTGLGLSTVYGIVKQNGGFIDVSSEPGQGSTFRIYLPRYRPESEGASGEAEVKAQGGSETVLVVEDEETVLNLTRTMLERLGYRVLSAKKTDQAMRLIQEFDGDIDLLLTDVVMPEMNGKELSDWIRALKPGIKCLYMSGYTADMIARQGLLDKGIIFISKPFTSKDLAVKIRETLEH